MSYLARHAESHRALDNCSGGLSLSMMLMTTQVAAAAAIFRHGLRQTQTAGGRLRHSPFCQYGRHGETLSSGSCDFDTSRYSHQHEQEATTRGTSMSNTQKRITWLYSSEMHACFLRLRFRRETGARKTLQMRSSRPAVFSTVGSAQQKKKREDNARQFMT